MTLYEQIQEDVKNAMKSGDNEAKDALRFLMAEIQKEVVDAGGDRTNIPDETTQKVLEKSVKSRKDSIKIFEEQKWIVEAIREDYTQRQRILIATV